MRTKTSNGIEPVTAAAFGLAVVLAALAMYNYATGIYGGAVVSSVGTVVATLFGALTEP